MHEQLSDIPADVIDRFHLDRLPFSQTMMRPDELMSLSGKRALVTGGGCGDLGQAIVHRLAAVGAHTAVLDIDGQAAETVAKEATDRWDADVFALAGDVTDWDGIHAAVATAAERMGGLDILVNNAGIRGRLMPLAEMDDDAFEEVIDINLRSVYRCMRAQLAPLYARGGGSIVNVASATMFGVSAGLAPYAASKMGVVGLSKVASKEAGPHGVRVNVVAPGRTDTPLFRSHAGGDSPEDAAALVAPIPLGRFADPMELAQAIVFLCSDRASFITGSTLVVDGGRTG